MKIKEVIKKTELTDKAIRLYIDNGLVAPSIDESYSGRKSIDFSSDDVERLSNIALLRKAGFSIADIKDIIESDEKAQAVVKRFIEETENNIQHETEIIEKLKNIPAENGISMKTICESLSKTVEKKQVPKEDMKLSALERTIRGFFCALGGLGMLVTVVGFVAYEILLRCEYKYPTYNSIFFSIVTYSGLILIFAMSFVLLSINLGKYVSSSKKSVRYLNSIVISLSYIILYFFIIVFSFFSIYFSAYSKTENPKNYMVLDNWLVNKKYFTDELYDVFPAEIPETAYKDSIKYFYNYRYTLDPSLDIFAEWKLPKDEYEIVKKADFTDEYQTFETENWNIVVFYEDNTNKIIIDDKYYEDIGFLRVFAYNDKEQKVRYISNYDCNYFPDRTLYESLDW